MNLVKINPRLRLIFYFIFCITPDSLILLLIAELNIFVKEYFSAYLGFELCPVVVYIRWFSDTHIVNCLKTENTIKYS